jgi:DNA-directed RNA polymerase specialized sigma24 family protein
VSTQPQPAFLPSFLHFEEQTIAYEVARFERDTKKTALSAPTTFQREKTAHDARTLVREYLEALAQSRADRMAVAHVQAMTPWPVYGWCGGDGDDAAIVAPDTLDEVVTGILQNKERADPAPEAQQEHLASSKPVLRPTWVNTQKAYVDYLAGLDGSEDELFGLVGRLAKLVAHDTLADSPRVSETLEDVAQKATIGVWTNLPTFNGVPEQFYSWVRTICIRTALDGFTRGGIESKLRAPFELETGENPAVQGGIECKRNGKTVYVQPRIQTPRELPEFIQGTDLKICQYIREGYNYARIGEILSMTEKAVSRRVAKMRDGVKAEADNQTTTEGGN